MISITRMSAAMGLAAALSAMTATQGWAVAPPVGVSDPGVRGGQSYAGGPLEGLSAADTALFFQGWERFKQTYSVSGTFETGAGLGPTFNAIGCSQCHAQPSAGGSSTSPASPQVRRVVLHGDRLALDVQPNPQTALGSLHRLPNAEQPVPSFITRDGPIRVARFIRKPDGTPDGEVHALYTISGRTDAPGCDLAPPDFADEMAAQNVVFRVPSATFGAGLVEAVTDPALESNLRLTGPRRAALGISGHFNRASDGKISRFGWKAQSESILTFSAEAHNVEIGATNEVYPHKRNSAVDCGGSMSDPAAGVQTDSAPTAAPKEGASESYTQDSSEVTGFVNFLRLSAPPQATTHTDSERAGQGFFGKVGCDLCHSATLQTGQSDIEPLSGVTFHPYSDFALHRMGPALADHVSQGVATGDEFRTAPLWGVGQRIFFLHDGRTTDLLVAIQAHASQTPNCLEHQNPKKERCESEANAVIRNFDALSASQRQNILDFLRSL